MPSNQKPNSSHRHERSALWRVAVYAVALWPVGCAVYDNSLLDGARLAQGGSGGMLVEPDAGGNGGSDPEPSGAGLDDGGSSGALGEAGSVSDAGDSAGGTGAAGHPTGGYGGMNNDGGAGAAGTSGGGLDGKAGMGGSGGVGGMLNELATGKAATASSFQTGHEAAKGNDNSATTRWCAGSSAFPQWWRVDLGAVHQLAQFTIRFEHPDRLYKYTLETSTNDMVYVLQGTYSGMGAVQPIELNAYLSARYVRITVTSATPLTVNGSGTWASFFEFSLTGY